MSICDHSLQLLESYGISLSSNDSARRNFSSIMDPVFHHWCHYYPVSKEAHYLVGFLLVLICITSVVGNTLVVIVFNRYRRLKSPANTLIVNLAVSDLFNGLLHPMAAYSSFKESWMFGRAGCEMYAALCGLFGLVSIITLTAIAIERCLVISVKPWYGGILFTNTKAKLSIIVIWIYCLVIMLPPFFGWGAFVPEGFLTSCSFDYLSRTPSNRSYFFYIFSLGFCLPILIISICYSFIMKTIFQNERDMKRNNVKKVYSTPKKRNDYKAAEMIMFVIAMFLLSWTPYSVIASIGQFGDRSILTPLVSVLPSLFAKMSTIYNPAIYGMSHRHFRVTLRRIFKKEQRRCSGERCGTNLSKNSSVIRSKTGGCFCLPNGGSDAIEENSYSSKKIYVGAQMGNPDNSRIIYVKKTQAIYGSCNDLRLGDRYNAITPNEVAMSNETQKKITSNKHGTPAVLSLRQNSTNTVLIRGIVFQKPHSIHQ